jgi:hypothetical protein
MNKLKLFTAFIIIVLIVLSILIICVLINNKLLIKESFYSDNNCPPYSVRLNASNSYKTLSKGFCSSASSGDANSVGDDYGQISGNKSPYKCPADSYRLNAKQSFKSPSKNWCATMSN